MGSRRRRILSTALGVALVAAGTAASAQSPPPARRSVADRIYFGGSVGLSFGDIDYVQIAPQVGVQITPKVSGGVAASFLRRRYSNPSTSTSDGGFDVYGRYRLVPQAFLQGQYSYTDFEYPLVSGGTTRDRYSALLAGGGWVQPLGGRASFVGTVLYDLTYSDDEPAPYADPWVVSGGVVFGF